MKKIALALIGAAVLGVTMTGCSANEPATNCVVDDKDRSTVDGKSLYRVYSSCGIFNIEDAALLGQFNSADTYASIEVGKTYNFETYGYRNGFMSMFPNITKATEVSTVE